MESLSWNEAKLFFRPFSNDEREVREIFLFGIGNAFYGVANLLINRGMPNPTSTKPIPPLSENWM